MLICGAAQRPLGEKVQKARPLRLILVLISSLLLLALPPERASFWSKLRSGDVHRVRREYHAALEDYQQAAAVWPSNSLPYIRQGQTYLALRDYARAQDAFLRAGRLGGLRGEVRLGLADSYAGLGAQASAMSVWRALVREPLWAAEAHYRLGRAYMEQGRWSAAEREFAAMLESQATSPARLLQLAHYNLGLLRADDEPAAAMAHLEQAGKGPEAPVTTAAQQMMDVLSTAQTVEDDAYVAALIGEAFLNVGELALARRQFEAALDLNPAYPAAHAYLGHILDQQGRDGRAVMHLAAAIDLDPSYVLGYYFFGVFFRDRGQFSRARLFFARALRLDPDNAALCVDMAQTYLAVPDYVSAEAWLLRAVELAPEEAQFHRILAQFYADHLIRVAERGIPAARQAVDLAPDDPLAHDVWGWALYLTGNLPAAQIALQRALELDPYVPRAHYHLGVVYAAQGRWHEARWEYTRVLDLDPGGPLAERARGALAEMARLGGR